MRTNTTDGVFKRDILEWHVPEEVLAVLLKDRMMGRNLIWAMDDRTHRLAVGLGINEDALRTLAEQHPTTATINVNGRYDALLTTIDRDKAKAFVEKELGAEIKPREVVRESDTLLREFLIG